MDVFWTPIERSVWGTMKTSNPRINFESAMAATFHQFVRSGDQQGELAEQSLFRGSTLCRWPKPVGTGVVKPIAVRGGLSAADKTHVAGRGVAVIAWFVGSDLVGARLIDLGCTG
jgi:hypothetical protein